MRKTFKSINSFEDIDIVCIFFINLVKLVAHELKATVIRVAPSPSVKTRITGYFFTIVFYF